MKTRYRLSRDLVGVSLIATLFLVASGCTQGNALESLGLVGASVDLHTITVNEGQEAFSGQGVDFTVNYSNRSDGALNFDCEIKPGGQKATLSAEPNTEDGDAEVSWPGLPPGSYRITCSGAAADRQGVAPQLLKIKKSFKISPLVLGATATQGDADSGSGSAPPPPSPDPTSSLALGQLQILDNQQIWGGNLRARVTFTNPNSDGGWIRCATSPVSEGLQLAQVTKETAGSRDFEFTYPENVSAEYVLMCTVGRDFSGPPTLKSERFPVTIAAQ